MHLGSGKKSIVEANGAHTHVDLQSATIQGGTLITAGGGVIQTADRFSVLDGSNLTIGAVNNKATVNINDNTYLTGQGTINNTGTINLGSAGNDTRLRWWRFREELDADQEFGSVIALPPDASIKADLAAPRWELTARGVKIDKEAIKKRLGRSPDDGDAIVMCLSEGARAAARQLR